MTRQPIKESHVKVLESLYSKILESGHTADELISMSRSEYNKALGKNITSETSFKAQIRRVNQIQDNISQVETKYIEKRKDKSESTVSAVKELTERKFGGLRFKSVVQDPEVIARLETFDKMVIDIKTKHGISEGKAIIRVRALLKVPNKDIRKLMRIDRDVLTHYGY